jgi:hypothetical protein
MNNQYKIENIPVGDLHFDYHNPRLAEFDIGPTSDESTVAKVLWDTMAVDEIILSIAASGFFQHEPLIAVDEVLKRKKVTVVIEGNRRLAAVKIILDPSLIDNSDTPSEKIKVSRQIKKDLEKLPVIKVASREEAWKYIGFKHINGPVKWGSLAKAQYISQIHREFQIPLETIATQIGDTNKTVQKLYQGLRVLEQSEKNKVFNRGDIMGSRLYFSHLYTALSYEGVRDYLGLNDNKDEIENPIKKNKTEEAGLFLTWLFGNKPKGIEPVIRSQNPDLRRLDSVLRKTEATVALKDGAPLMTAYEISQPNKEIFENALVEAKQNLLKANSYWSLGYDSSLEALQIAGNIANLADTLYESMEKKYNETLKPSTKKRISQ